MKFVYLFLALFCVGCYAETYSYQPETTVWVDGYYTWNGGVRVFVPGRYVHRYNPRAYRFDHRR